jgi:hypothetical protein
MVSAENKTLTDYDEELFETQRGMSLFKIQHPTGL